MKHRIGAMIALLLLLVVMTGSFGFAGNPAGAEAKELTIVEQAPEDGETGMVVDNFSIKLTFNQDVKPATPAIRKHNREAVTLADKKGKRIPIYVAYHPDKAGQVLIVGQKGAAIQSDTDYVLTIDPTFQATSGAKLTNGDTVRFKTLNQSLNTTISMVIMGVMIVGMIFYTSKSMKKQQEKEGKGGSTAVNPYKEAKKTGKSVADIVAKDKKAKEKEAGKQAKGATTASEAKGLPADHKRVAAPRPISAAGATYKHPTKKKQAPPKAKSNKGTGKAKQSGKKKKK